MIGFGELRAKALEWRMDISAVEKIYALHRLVQAIYNRPVLSDALALTDGSALRLAYFRDYPPVESLDLGRVSNLADDTLEAELLTAADAAASASGIQFRFHSFQPSEARIEFTGPLGRRSAAQPLLVVRLVPTGLRLPPPACPLLYPFRDGGDATVRAVALSELAAFRILAYSRKPRAREVFDLWFILTHAGNEELLPAETRALVQALAGEKGVTPRAALDPNHAPFLERAWDTALKSVPHPPFPQAIAAIQTHLMAFL